VFTVLGCRFKFVNNIRGKIKITHAVFADSNQNSKIQVGSVQKAIEERDDTN
jgi:hypothetical protein